MKRHIPSAFAALALVLGGVAASAPLTPAGTFSFVVVADMRAYAGPDYRGSGYFLGAVEAIRGTGPSAFMLIPGDLDPPHNVIDDVTSTLGPALPVYVAVGNHDKGSAAYMTTIRRLNAGGSRLPNIVRTGPPGCEETMYAVEWGDAHIAVLNDYFDGTSDTAAKGDVTDATLAWLASDLASTTKPFVFVVGHNPAYVFPDMTSGRVRHGGGGLEANLAHRDRFWKLLQDRNVTAYICGHTHNASATNVRGVWQLDTGHARGKGDEGAPSTFVRITVGDGEARYEYHRADSQDLNYRVVLSGVLAKE